MDTVEYFPVPASLAPLKLPFSEDVIHARQFIRWLDGDFEPGSRW
jgi:hypothetical protein